MNEICVSLWTEKLISRPLWIETKKNNADSLICLKYYCWVFRFWVRCVFKVNEQLEKFAFLTARMDKAALGFVSLLCLQCFRDTFHDYCAPSDFLYYFHFRSHCYWKLFPALYLNKFTKFAWMGVFKSWNLVSKPSSTFYNFFVTLKDASCDKKGPAIMLKKQGKPQNLILCTILLSNYAIARGISLGLVLEQLIIVIDPLSDILIL